MSSQTPVINVSGDYEETILRLAKHLGRDKARRAVFNLIYGRGSKPRSKKQIAETLGRTANGQLIQNSLDHLAKHHLIVRLENAGHAKDGSRWVYAKDSSVRANRDKIIKFADDPAAAKKVPTKRQQSVSVSLSLVRPVTRSVPRRGTAKRSAPARLKIALLVTNPERSASLQTGIEARYIDEAIKLSGRASEIELKIFLAPTFDTLIDALNSYKPDIVHFSGHGGGGALLFDNDKAGQDGGVVLEFSAIKTVIDSTLRKPTLLVLAACDTVKGADQFLEVVSAVIAMSDSIEDEAACEFSARLYRSIATGASLRGSVTQAKAVLEQKNYADALLPELIAKDDRARDHVFVV